MQRKGIEIEIISPFLLISPTLDDSLVPFFLSGVMHVEVKNQSNWCFNVETFFYDWFSIEWVDKVSELSISLTSFCLNCYTASATLNCGKLLKAVCMENVVVCSFWWVDWVFLNLNFNLLSRLKIRKIFV